MKYAVILNPVSGNYPHGFVEQAIKENFSKYKIFETTKDQGAFIQTQKALNEGFQFIVACGGDGTVTETASALIGKDAALGIIPAGTGNMLAANLGIPLNLKDSIKIIKNGTLKKIDIGKVNDKYFTFMMGCGLNSDIIEQTTREKKQKYGYWAYFIETIKKAFNPPHVKYKIKLDDKKIIKVKAFNLIIANKANFLGEAFSLAPDASIFDGELDLIITSVIKNIDYVHYLWNILTKQHFVKPGRMNRYRFKKAEIVSTPKMKVQVDGDIQIETPITVNVIPQAVNVFIPKKKQANLINTAEDSLIKLFNQIKVSKQRYYS